MKLTENDIIKIQNEMSECTFDENGFIVEESEEELESSEGEDYPKGYEEGENDKCYTLKVRIPCVVYKDVYVYATNQKEAKKITKDWLNAKVGADPFDFSGDYDEDQMYHKGVIESVVREDK